MTSDSRDDCNASPLPGHSACTTAGLTYVHREAGPSSQELPSGASKHLVIVSTAAGVLNRETNGLRARHRVEPGFVTVVPKGQPVRWWWDEPMSYSVLALDDACVSKLGAEKPRLRFSERVRDPAIASIANLMARLAPNDTADGASYANSLASLLASHLVNSYAAGQEAEKAEAPHSRPIARAVAYIASNYASDVHLEDIARAAYLSPFHLARMFKRETGLAPHQYLVRVRLEAARRMLAAQPAGNLSEIATNVGFYDQSHMTRQFRRAFGMTPRQMGNGSVPRPTTAIGVRTAVAA